jgi:hypothetical protein
MNSIRLEDTIVGRVEYSDGDVLCVKGAIEEPVNCSSPVFYKALFQPQSDGVSVCIYGVAGLDAEYECRPFRWIWNPILDELTVDDWEHQQRILHDDFDKYKNHVYYMYAQERNYSNPILVKDDLCVVPYYRYPRTKDGPLIPELVTHVLGHLPSIHFVLQHKKHN